MKFTWSDAKRESNLKRHGIDFVDALEIFCAHGVPIQIRVISIRKATTYEEALFFENFPD
jgi:uncharacterized DUF497 family protein